MKKVTLLVAAVVLSAFLWSCSSGSQENKAIEKKVEKTEKTETKKIGSRDLTVELYSKIINEQRELLMGKYWEQLKGKEYNEVKDKYAEYKKEDDAIIAKYNLDNELVLSSFFRSNYSEVEKFRKSDPNAKEYPEYNDAKNKMIDLSSAYMVEKN
jgi:hypothetical protein